MCTVVLPNYNLLKEASFPIAAITGLKTRAADRVGTDPFPLTCHGLLSQNQNNQATKNYSGGEMKEDTKKSLDTLFEAQKSKKEVEIKKAEERARSAEQFLSDFYKCRDEIIKPAMEEIGKYIKDKGVSFHIESNDERTDNREYQAASISIRFLTDSGSPSSGRDFFPYVSVVAAKDKQTVWFGESTIILGRGGHSESTGEAPLSAITEELIHKKVYAVLKEILS
jgi:hypothetical protein